MTLTVSCAFPPSPETPALIEFAEQLGYARAYVYDTPALQLDVWMTLAMGATRTSRIGLGTGVLIPSLRHPLATASAIATMEAIAPGRTVYGVGSGFTGRRALGQLPMKWADVVTYVEQVQAMLRGDHPVIDGKPVGMIHGLDQAPERPIEVPWLVAASGPKGIAAAHKLGGGVFSTSPIAGFAHNAILAFGTVFDDGEEASSERVRRAAGPGAAVVYHAILEQNPDVLTAIPGGTTYRALIEQTPEETRHLDVHRGHLVALNQFDEPAMTGEIAAQFTLSGPPAMIRERLATMEAGGATEIAYQPAGPDMRRELRAFIQATAGS